MLVTIEEAQARLSQLIEHLQTGEEVTITRDGKPVARLIGTGAPEERPQRKMATMKGTVLYMAPDFDAPLSFDEGPIKLEDLVRGITDENRHDEVDWGPAVGEEVW